MSIIYNRLLAWLALTEDQVDPWWFRFRKKRGLFKKLEIEGYRGFGTQEEVHIRGRVLRYRGIRIPKENQSRWGNFKNMYRRFGTDEIPGVKVKAIFQTEVLEYQTDEEGYFDFTLFPRDPQAVEPGWQPVSFLMEPHNMLNAEPVAAMSKVVIPPKGARFGLISDIDDTLLVTDVASRLRMLQHTFLENALTRKSFPGTAQVYQRLHTAPDGTGFNPVFYLSSSPWNLYDFLERFLNIQQFPEGPLILRDLGISRKHLLGASHGAHKSGRIRELLTLFPDLPFLLIGDSGEQDPFIFAKAVENFPGRIQHVFIRDVAKRKEKPEMESLARACQQYGTGFTFFDEAEEILQIADAAGWFS